MPKLKRQGKKPKDDTGRGVEFQGVDGKNIKGEVARMSDQDNRAIFAEYILNNKRYEERMTM